MASYRSSRGRLWVVLMVALGGALVSLLALVQWESPARAIAGGTAVSDGKYPFIAYLSIEEIGGQGRVGHCGGSLIDRDSVLTAAHCLDNPDLVGNEIRVYAVVGRTVISQHNQGQTRFATHYFIHPRYKLLQSGNNRAPVYDVAVLKLESAVTGIQPIALATANQNYLENPGRILTAAGWGGMTFNTASDSDRMHEVSVPVVSDSRAGRVVNAEVGARVYEPPIMVASGKTGKGSCKGDSGGPLFDSGSRTQVGVNSFGREPCGTPPDVATEVNNPTIRNWILDAARR